MLKYKDEADGKSSLYFRGTPLGAGDFRPDGQTGRGGYPTRAGSE